MSTTKDQEYMDAKCQELLALSFDDYARLIKLHDGYNKHVRMQWSGYKDIVICKDCLMPIRVTGPEGNEKSLTIGGNIGTNCGDNTQYILQISQVVPHEMFTRLIMALVEGKGHNILTASLPRGNAEKTVLMTVLRQYLNPIFAQRRGISPNSMSGLAFYMGKQEGAQDDTRNTACRAPRLAYEYAIYVDNCKPHPATRLGASKHAAYAYEYAKGVDKCYHDLTMIGAMEKYAEAAMYLAKFSAEPKVRTRFFEKWVKAGKVDAVKEYLRYAPRDPGVTTVLENMLPEEVYRVMCDRQVLHSDKLAEAMASLQTNGQAPLVYYKATSVNDPRIVKSACDSAAVAVAYARQLVGSNVPANPELRTAACRASQEAYDYACCIDKAPSNETRDAASTEPYTALRYAREVDRTTHPVTKRACLRYAETAYKYALYITGPDPDLKAAACMHPEYALQYAESVDKNVSRETELAASYDPNTERRYVKFKERLHGTQPQ
jgi:hypothetical protein